MASSNSSIYSHISEPGLSICSSDGEKEYLPLQFTFSSIFQDPTTYLILIEKSTGIVYCVYSLIDVNADPVFYDETNPNPQTKNIFNNMDELTNIGEHYFNPYSQFHNIFNGDDNQGNDYAPVTRDQLRPHLDRLSSRDIDINQIDYYNVNDEFLNISLNLHHYDDGKIETKFTCGIRECTSTSSESGDLSEDDGKKKSKKRRSKKKSKKSKRRSKKKSKRN